MQVLGHESPFLAIRLAIPARSIYFAGEIASFAPKNRQTDLRTWIGFYASFAVNTQILENVCQLSYVRWEN